MERAHIQKLFKKFSIFNLFILIYSHPHPLLYCVLSGLQPFISQYFSRAFKCFTRLLQSHH